jgi:hypothetical protein
VRELSLAECTHVGEDHLDALRREAPGLRKLDLNGTGAEVTPEAAEGISRLRHLAVLYLRQARVGDEALLRIAAACPALTELDLGRCESVGDRGVAGLGALDLLRSVSLNGTAVTDLGLLAFAGGGSRHTLRELRIDGCRNVSDDGVEGILHLCRHLNIFIFHNCPGVTGRSRDALESYLAENHATMKQLTWTVY